MRRHEPLIAMRRRGMRPALVTLTDLPSTTPWEAWRETLPFPDVEIEPSDSPELVDLRFVVGLPVLVSIDDEQRMRRLVLAAEQAGAGRVYGCADGVPTICTEGEDQSWRG